MPESADAWRDRMMEEMGAAAAKLPEEDRPLANIVLGASVHMLVSLRYVIDDQAGRQAAALDAQRGMLAQIARVVDQLDRGLGVADEIRGQALERAEDLAAQIGARDPDQPLTLIERIERIERGGRRRDWLIAALLLTALLHLALSWAGLVPGPLGLAGGL